MDNNTIKQFDVRIINSVITASTHVLKEITQKSFEFKKPHIQQNPFIEASMAISVGIIGDFKANVTISLSDNLPQNIVDCMMPGFGITINDDMGKRAISEVGNMIMGNVSTQLFSKEIKTNITPPTLFMSEKISITAHQALQ